MPFQPGQSGNPGGRSRETPIRDAIRMEQALAAQGLPCEAPPGSYRYIARQLLIRAGEDNTAFNYLADRSDGKPVQVVEDVQGNEIPALDHDEMVLEFTRIVQNLGIADAAKLTVRRTLKGPRKSNRHSEE